MNENTFAQHIETAFQNLEVLRQLANKAPASLKAKMMEATGSLSTALEQVQLGEEASQYRQAREALRKSKELHRVVLSNMSDAVFVTNESGAFVYICPNVANIFGYSFEEVRTFGHIKSLLGDTLVEYNNLKVVGEIENIERKIKDKSGQKHILLINVKHTSINRGTMLYTCRDITQRRSTERALQKSEAFNQAVLSSLAAHIAVIANDGTVIAVNDSWERFARENGAASNARIGVGANYLVVCRRAINEDDSIAREALAGIQGVLDGSESHFGLEYPCHSPTKQRWFLMHVTPLRNGHSGAVVLHTDITQRKQAEEEKTRLLEAVSAQSQQLRTLSARLAETEEAERKQLARELHDQVGQNLSAVGLNLTIIREAIRDAIPQSDTIKTRVNESLALVEEITARIRDVMANLRPPVLDDYGLVAALDWYGTRFSKRADLIVRIQGEEPSPRLATPTENALFRIAQEALTNAAKHAQARQVVVRIEADNNIVRLVIADDGIGFESVGPGESWGLLNMSERAEAVGGYCRVISRPEQGTQVIVEVNR